MARRWMIPLQESRCRMTLPFARSHKMTTCEFQLLLQVSGFRHVPIVLGCFLYHEVDRRTWLLRKAFNRPPEFSKRWFARKACDEMLVPEHGDASLDAWIDNDGDW